MSPRYSKLNHLIAELLSAEDMEVQVHDGLAAVRAAVVDDAVAAAEAFDLSDLRDGFKAARDPHAVLRGYLVGAGNMSLGNDEDMHRSLRVDVTESVDILILIDLCAGDIPGDYLAEQAIVHFNISFFEIKISP